MLNYFDNNSIKERIRHSNYWASFNRNSYPLQIEKLTTCGIYQCIDCPCDDSCNCKKYGCEKHYVRISDDFNKILNSFLECFVDYRNHGIIKDILNGTKLLQKNHKRIQNIPSACHEIQEGWETFKTIHKTNLLCTNWLYAPFDEKTKQMQVSSNFIYTSKWLSILDLGTFIAFDTQSIRLINKDFSNPVSYKLFMDKIRSDLMNYLDSNQIKIHDFLLIDNPSEFFPSITKSPRPIGNILDKIYLTL